MSQQTVDFEISIGGGAVIDARVIEGLSEVTRARIVFASGDDESVSGAAGGGADVTLRVDGAVARTWTLQIAEVRFLGTRDGALHHEITLWDPLGQLGLGKNTRKFRQMSTRDIVTSVLGGAGLSCVWKAERGLVPKDFCVQYRESDLAFFQRLLEDEGVYFTTEPGGVVVCDDRSPASPQVDGEGHYELVEAAGALGRRAAGIHAIGLGAKVASGAVEVNDYDWKRPALSLRARSAAAEDAELEVYEYPAGHRDPGEGAALSQIRLEACRAGAVFVEGRASVPGFAPARRFHFGGEVGAAFEGDYVLSHVEHIVKRRPPDGDGEAEQDAGLEEIIYQNEFRAIPRATPFRPPLSTPRPKVAGHHTAMVRGPAGSDIHTDEHGRFNAQFHWDREATGTDADSRWIRLLQEPSSSMALARVGWEMKVAYIDGDPSRPVGIGRLMNGEMMPTFAQPAHKERTVIRTPSSPKTGGHNEIVLDDRAGAMMLSAQAERDMLEIVRNDKRERTGADLMRSVGGGLTRLIEQDQTIRLAADARTASDGNQGIEVGGNRRRTVRGDESVRVGAAASLQVGGDEQERVASSRTTMAGGIGAPDMSGMVERQKQSAISSMMGGQAPSFGGFGSVTSSLGTGSITRAAQKGFRRTVGAALLSATADAATTQAGLAHAEIVGGAKLTLARKEIAQQVGGALLLTVGGVVMRTAKGDMTYQSGAARVTVGGAATLTAGEKLTLQSKVIQINAMAGLTLRSGDLEIRLDPASVAIKGKLSLKAGGDITDTGGKINITKAEG